MRASRPVVEDGIVPKVPETRFQVDPVRRRVRKGVKKIKMLPSQWVSEFVRIKDADTGTISKMDFSERRYLLRAYNTPRRRVLLFTSRQTEKCVSVDTQVSMADGRLVRAGDIRVGDEVASMLPDGTVRLGRVAWVSRRRQKAGVRIETRQGHVLEAALTHPIRVWGAWKDAGKLTVGERVAAVRKCGVFGGACVSQERIRLTAYLIGDGSVGGKTIGFTAVPGPVLDEFTADVQQLGGTYRTYQKKNNRAIDIRLRHLPILKEWLREDGLLGKTSRDKAIPSWVFSLSKANTALFLNRLWATDGHVSQRTRSNYNIVYASISRTLIEQVQALLWKFRIPSRIRMNWPSIYKRRGEHRFAYLLNVETKIGIETFLSEIGALGKSEDVALPECASNNNNDTLPIEVQDLISRIVASAGYGQRSELFEAGLHRTLPYAPTYEKVQQYVDLFEADSRYDQRLVGELRDHLTSDLYWDRVKSMTALDALECVDFEIEGTHNFIASGLVTHNSTTLGNKLFSLSGMRSIYSSLFVTPSAMQTKVFSNSRIDDIIDVSPMIKAMTHKSLVMNILEKEFINRSKIYLRYAFLSADRIRGLSVNSIFLDEIQDLLQELLPVIEETASHHKDSLFFYSGTPKTYDNTIEEYWAKHSTQSEWVIPCERHGVPGDPSTWHWNVLGLKHIGKHGPICERCGGPLNPEHPLADWVEMSPGAQIEGLRVCRLMVPWFFKDPAKWKEILEAYERYPAPQFHNEVLALSYDSGTKPLTRLELVRCCDSKYDMDEEAVAALGQRHELYAGIDWGEGTGQGAYTVLAVGGYVRGDDKFQYVFFKRFDGALAEPGPQMEEIKRLLVKFRIKYTGADHGAGFVQNKQLISIHGPGKIFPFQYVGRAPFKLGYKPALHRYLLFRSLVLADFFSAIKCGTKIRFPGWSVFREPYASDFLNVRAEYNEAQRLLQYIKIRGKTDDTMHAAFYCLMASMHDYRRPDIMAPMRESSEEAQASYNEEHMREMLEGFAPPMVSMDDGTL